MYLISPLPLYIVLDIVAPATRLEEGMEGIVIGK